MRSIQRLIITVIVLVGINATHIFAEETTISELRSLDQKIATIEAKIDRLEKKGLENLTDEEFVKYSELSDKLLKTQKEKTAEQRNIIKAIDETDKKIDELSGMTSTSK